MRLSKIRLSGFKSFVDPTTIQFPSNLTGIVGPNGCGKSNVIDAIRWVLGETSAKTLRGDSMADVIFNGSSGRKAVGQASIELVFDNTDGTITGAYAGYTEVAVRRVVARDGTSQYFLNNSRCRRKDITHILLGTGLGAHGYSIIEQGMISRLVEAKPEELRAFLEEAAGISKYKERRKETEHRIRHTRENLDRLNDLREEIEKQLAHLQRQAKAAERYKELKAEERRTNAELLALRLAELRAEAGSQEHTYKEKQLALDAAITAQRSVEAEIEKLRVELGERNESFNAIQGAYYKVGAEIARLEQAIQHRKQLMQRQENELAETNQQLAEISGHIEDDQVELKQLDLLLSELHPNLEEANRRLRESEADLKEAELSLERRREHWERVSQQIAETERTGHVEEARIEQLLAQLERRQREHAEQLGERESLSYLELEQELEKLVAAEETLKSESAAATRAVESIWRDIQELRQREAESSETLDGLRENVQNDRGRLSSLEALQEAAFGKLSQQVNGWLQQRSLDSQPRLVDTLEVETGWERAVETVLDGYLQAVNVPSLDALTDDLGEIAEGGLALIEGGLSNESRGTSSGAGWLVDKVSAPDSAAGLLAGIRVAESLGEAVRMRRGLGEGQSIITRDGVWLGKHWLRIHSSDDPQLGALSRGEEIEQLTVNVRDTSARVEEITQALGEDRRRLEELEERRAAVQLEANEKQQTYTQVKSELESKRSALDATRKRAAALDAGIATSSTEIVTLSAALTESRRKLEVAGRQLGELQTERQGLEADRAQHQVDLEQARIRTEAHRKAAQEIAIQVESRRSSKQSASTALSRIKLQQQHLLKRQGELLTHADELKEPLAQEEETLVAKLDERLAVEARMSEARQQVETCDTQVRDAESRRNEQQQLVGEARELVDTARLAVRESQVRAESVAEQFQKTGFELERVIAELPESASIPEWSEALERIEKRIQRLGAINLAAIDEFAEQSERKAYLDTQFKDLSDALETLEAAIRKIDRETRSRFKETFDKANLGISELFPRLFGGGHAYLELDSDDLLSSGVTIMARPPGKKISTIHLLSGGEKALTAVALVFSIFHLNPAPFCLLDEVDAPLDDANVGRFSEIVREMSTQVQFVIITHNKTTMEAMNQLAGVTMHEPGVSRLVAVDIDEAVKLAAI